MITPAKFREVVSGRRQGLQASLLRILLRCLETPYALLTALRNIGYDYGLCKIESVNTPVISVGNLTLGGTGKTPLVQWLARWYQDRSSRVALVSRGYKAAPGSLNDEARELAEKLARIPHIQNRNRVQAARQAICDHQSQLILLDDGFQHRRLDRDLDIVLIDALEPYGYDHIFPRGMLRESLNSLCRADAIGLSRTDAVSAQQRKTIRNRIQALAPQAVWFETVHQPYQLIRHQEPANSLTWLRNRSVAAFCGLGNPSGFQHTLTTCDCQIAAFRALPDHYAYTQQDLQSLATWLAHEPTVDAVVCTCKDLVKIGRSELAGIPLYALDIGMRFVHGQSDLEARLQRLLTSRHTAAA
ncbi:MAG: tetraacyldisaccharide 4'-kinase [Planctomycetota bacterium]|nr:tetraacyldisaccharide 4'-kinase [Planctomycetota bacterium]